MAAAIFALGTARERAYAGVLIGRAKIVMRLVISLAALLASVFVLQLASGGLGPLDVLSGLALGFTTAEIGLLGSAHFAGFFLGCWGAPRLLGTVGHARSFAAFAAFGAIGTLAHMMIVDPLAWAAMRVLSGLSVAGCYTVVEAWMQARVTNANRGRTLGAYRGVDLAALLIAQLLIGVLEPAAYVSYNILAILCCVAILPILLTRVEPPPVIEAPRLRPARAFRVSPLAAVAVVVAGVSSSSFRMVGPVYGAEVGLGADQIALFLAAYVAGGAVAQLPVGWLSDKIDRRHVMMMLSICAILACVVTIWASGQGARAVFLAAVAFGIATVPVYSVAAAHANDFARPAEAVEMNAALLFVWAIGAVISPVLAAGLISRFGPSALFVLVAAMHLVLVLVSLWRMTRRPPPGTRTPYRYLPRTSAVLGRLMGRRK